MERIRPTYEKPMYGFNSAYKALDVPREMRDYYEDYNLAKSEANRWFAKEDIPLLLRFRPAGEYVEKSLMSNMTLQLFYILPDSSQHHIITIPCSKNQIKLNAHWRELAKWSLKIWDTFEHKDSVYQRAKAAKAYAMAY